MKNPRQKTKKEDSKLGFNRCLAPLVVVTLITELTPLKTELTEVVSTTAVV